MLGSRHAQRRMGLVLALVASGVISLRPVSDAAVPQLADGRSMATAAASCWAAKRAVPASRSGVYWLRTQTMPAAQQFYCDMVTDGGGWVLVGRGREGWTFDERGQSTPEAVRNAIDGRGAFSPAALSTATIDGLLAGRSVKDLDDGVRLVRSTNTRGTKRQTIMWRFHDLTSWSWSISGGHRLRTFTIDGRRFRGGNTRNSADAVWGEVGPGNRSADGVDRWITDDLWFNGGKKGFGFGRTVVGTRSPTSHLYSATNGGYAFGFTQVWIRPTIMVNTPSVIPSTGTPASTIPAGMSSISEWMPAGVVGVLKDGDSEPLLDVPVMAFAEHGSRVFVGGKFSHVELGQGGPRAAQPYLAAFDRDSGNWINTFRPRLNGTVWDMAVTPDGLLIVAGQFDTVNKRSSPGVVALDPNTGQRVASWSARVGLTCPAPGGGEITCRDLRPVVRAIDVDSGFVYLAGNFTQVMDATRTSAARVGRVARVDAVTGAFDGRFRPVPDLPVADIDATPTRVYLAGFFHEVNGRTADAVAVVQTSDGQLVRGMKPTLHIARRPDLRYQQAILEVGGVVWQAGSEHTIQAHRRSDYGLLRSWMTFHRGGDGQAIVSDGRQVFVGSHVDSNLYTDAVTYPGLAGYTRVDQARWVTAFDATTRQHSRDFVIEANSASGEGAWELQVDSRGCLWIGGDFVGASVVNGARRYAAGFFKVCPKDSVAPASPSNLRVRAASRQRVLSWTGARDDRAGAVRYEVMRNDRVVALVSGTSWTDIGATRPGRYFVRAIDAAGNRSASTPVTVG